MWLRNREFAWWTSYISVHWFEKSSRFMLHDFQTSLYSLQLSLHGQVFDKNLSIKYLNQPLNHKIWIPQDLSTSKTLSNKQTSMKIVKKPHSNLIQEPPSKQKSNCTRNHGLFHWYAAFSSMPLNHTDMRLVWIGMEFVINGFWYGTFVLYFHVLVEFGSSSKTQAL